MKIELKEDLVVLCHRKQSSLILESYRNVMKIPYIASSVEFKCRPVRIKNPNLGTYIYFFIYIQTSKLYIQLQTNIND